jgi:predicted nucleic acid-binding protein
MEVVKRPKFEKYFGEQEIADLLILFDYYGQLVPVSSKIEICRDPKDNFLLALAKDGDVDYLITGENHCRCRRISPGHSLRRLLSARTPTTAQTKILKILYMLSTWPRSTCRVLPCRQVSPDYARCRLLKPR